MSLHSNMIKRGNWLFRYRSYVPLFMFIAVIPFLWHDTEDFGSFQQWEWGLTCLIISLLGLLVRVIVILQTPDGTSGRNVNQQEASTLNTKGIYSMVRHPLYLGNFLMWLGLILYAGSVEFLIFAVFFFWIYYERIMFAEEEFLRAKFGKQFEVWAELTPAFFPSFKHYEPTLYRFNWKRIIHREYHGIAALIISFAYLNFLKNLLQLHQLYLRYRMEMGCCYNSCILYFRSFSCKKNQLIKIVIYGW